MTNPRDLEPDHPYVRECQAETSGDEISKADYMEMLLREMYEDESND